MLMAQGPPLRSGGGSEGCAPAADRWNWLQPFITAVMAGACDELRAPKTASSGGRPGVLTEPEPQGQERPRTFLRSQVAPEPRALLLQQEEVKLKQMLDQLRACAEPLARASAQDHGPPHQDGGLVLFVQEEEKKRRKRRLPRTPSVSSSRRPFRQWVKPCWFCFYGTSRCVPSRCRQAQDAPHHGR